MSTSPKNAAGGASDSVRKRDAKPANKKQASAIRVLASYSEEVPLRHVREIINSCEGTIRRIRDCAHRLGLSQRNGVYESATGPFLKNEWNEAFTDLRTARQLLRALTYDAAVKAEKDLEETCIVDKRELVKYQEERRSLNAELSKYRRVEGQWVGATDSEQARWEESNRVGKEIRRRMRSVPKAKQLSVAKQVIKQYERDIIHGHADFKGYKPESVATLYAADLDRRRGQLAALAANKLSDNEGLCRLGRDAVGSTWRRLVVDKLPSLASSRDQIQRILTLAPEYIEQIRDSLSVGYHTDCKDPNCALEGIIRRLGEGIRDNDDNATPRPEDSGSTTAISCTDNGGHSESDRLGQALEDIMLCGGGGEEDVECEYDIEVSTSGNDKSTDPREQDGIFGISITDTESDNSEEDFGDSRSTCDSRGHVSPTPSVSCESESTAGEQSSGEGASDSSKSVFSIHLTDPRISYSAKVQGRASNEASPGEEEGLPKPVKSRRSGGEVRCDNSGDGPIIVAIGRGENIDGHTGNKPERTMESKQLCDAGMVRDDTNSELVLQSPSIGQAEMGGRSERVHGRSDPSRVEKRLLDQIPKQLRQVQNEGVSQNSYTRHLGCTDTFRLLPQPTKESLRTRLGYYPSTCAHGVEITPLRGEANGTVIGSLLSGNPGYSIIVISEAQTKSLRQGKEIVLRSTFGSERLQSQSIRKVRETTAAKGTQDDSVQNNKIQPNAGKVHKAHGAPVVQVERPPRKQVDRKRDEQPSTSKAPLGALEPSGRPSSTIVRPNKVGPALQQRVDKNNAFILSDNNTRRGIKGPTTASVNKHRFNESRDQIPVSGRSDERRHDNGAGELRLTCYHCLNSVQGDSAKNAWIAVENDRRRGRFRGRGKQVLCEDCSERNEDMVRLARPRVEGRTRSERLPSNTVLPVKTTEAPRNTRNGSGPSQGARYRIHHRRQARAARVSERTMENEGNPAPRPTGVRSDFPVFEREVPNRQASKNWIGVRDVARRSRQGRLERRGK